MRRFWLIPVLLAAAVVWAGLDRDAGLRTWWQLRADLGDSRQRVAGLEAEVETLEQASRELDGDPFALERAIREDLGLARPGEVVVRFSRSDHSND